MYCCSGADKLITILSYVVIQTQCPDLVAESTAVMDFAREKFVVVVFFELIINFTIIPTFFYCYHCNAETLS